MRAIDCGGKATGTPKVWSYSVIVTTAASGPLDDVEAVEVRLVSARTICRMRSER